jgi:hypothetical protein
MMAMGDETPGGERVGECGCPGGGWCLKGFRGTPRECSRDTRGRRREEEEVFGGKEVGWSQEHRPRR